MDRAEFEKLYAMHKSVLERYARYKLPSKADADDVLQEVAISAFKSSHSIKNRESFKAYILKIAMNKCNDFYRALAKRQEIPFDDVTELVVSMSRYGISSSEIVRDVIESMADKDKQILFLYYLKNKPQAEIAALLKVPLGTVKSRLHTAKQNFKQAYPATPSTKLKGENNMKTLPYILPKYKITPSGKLPFECKWEEMMGWFIVPKIGEKIAWAMYDFPERKRTEICKMEVVGRACVHGIEGVEITATQENPQDANKIDGSKTVERSFVAQLTDTHCRILAQSHTENNMKKLFTFLDGDDFLPNWGFGEDNCGNETNLRTRGIITKEGNNYICREDKQVMDVVGRFDIEINGKIYDTICVADSEIYNSGVFSEQYIDQNGKTILWRRYNKNDWNYKHYNKLWSEALPKNEQITVNGELYIHWYDCITDYVL